MSMQRHCLAHANAVRGNPGNHDRRIQMCKAFPDPADTADRAINAMRSVGELDILLIDLTVPNAPHAELDAATAGRKFSRSSPKPSTCTHGSPARDP